MFFDKKETNLLTLSRDDAEYREQIRYAAHPAKLGKSKKHSLRKD